MEGIFDMIRKESKFCSRCGQELDLQYLRNKVWHLPFCMKCRNQLTEEAKKGFKNEVKTNNFEYQEEVKEFTGLIFHCPNCDEVFHLHIATVHVGD